MNNQCTPPPAPKPKVPAGAKAGGALAAIVGIPAAAILFGTVPHDESGRTVAVEVQDGEIYSRHVSGRQYLTAYADIVGVWTICDGDTKGVRAGMVETESGCFLRLERQLAAHASGVMKCTPGLRGDGRDNQRAAAVSLAYNIGVSGYCGSTVARRFNAGNYAGACDAFLMWNKARVAGKLRPVRGLTLRRERERALCRQGLK